MNIKEFPFAARYGNHVDILIVGNDMVSPRLRDMAPLFCQVKDWRLLFHALALLFLPFLPYLLSIVVARSFLH